MERKKMCYSERVTVALDGNVSLSDTCQPKHQSFRIENARSEVTLSDADCDKKAMVKGETDRAFLIRTCFYCGFTGPYKSFPNGSICYLGIMACNDCLVSGKAVEFEAVVAMHETLVLEDYG